MLRRPLRVALLAAAAFVWSVAAQAQPDDAVTRSNTLFDEGKRLLGEGKVAEACDKLAASNQLVARGGTLLNLGLCHEQQGKYVAARRELRDALTIAKRDARNDRVPVATEHLAAVEAKLSWIKIVPPVNVTDDKLDMRLDDAPIARRDWPAVPVEAGRHLIVASATGFRPGELAVTIPEGAPKHATATLDPLRPLDGAAPVPIATKTATPGGGSTTAAIAASGDGKTLRTAALIVGISGFVVSLATGAWALERKSVVRAHCNSDTKLCDATGTDAASLGRALTITSTAAFAVGAIGIGAWVFLPTNTSPSTGSAQGGSAGITLKGTF